MNNKKLKYIIIGVVFLITILVLFTFSGGSKANPINSWKKTYDLDDQSPYGLFDFQQLIISDTQFTVFNEYSGPQTFFHAMDSIDNSLAMFVGNEFFLTDDEIVLLLNSISNGQDAFISLERFPKKLLTFSGSSPDFGHYYLSNFYSQYDEKEVERFHIFNTDTLPYHWHYIDSVPNNWDYDIFSKLNDEVNFISIKIGKGKLMLHSNPMLFTNIYLKDSLGLDYLSFTLDQFEQEEVLWPKFADDDLSDVNPYQDEFSGGDHSLLSEIFKYSAFKWAFTIALLGGILFLIFRAKRKQPIIPVISDEKGTGQSFVTTIAGIYYNKKQPKVFKNIIRRNFYANVKNFFFIDLQSRNRTKNIYRLAEKANVDASFIESILKSLDRTDDAIGDERLAQIHHDIMRFYKLSGIWGQRARDLNLYSTTNFYRKRAFNNGYIVGGIMMIIFGFLLLSYAVGFGVLFWPFGIAMLYVGSNSAKNPYVSISQKWIKVTNLWGKTITFNINDIEESKSFRIEKSSEKIVIKSNDKKAVINLLFFKPSDRYELSKIELKNK